MEKLREPLNELNACGLPEALEVMGERWSFMILRASFNGLHHFEEFLCELGIARNILSNRLAKLVEHGILEEAADIGISVIPRPVATLTMIPLFREELRLYCGKGHPLFAIDPAALGREAVLDYPLIEPSVVDDAGFAQSLENFAISGQANSLDSRIMLVLSGLYLGFLPPQYAAPWIASGDLRELSGAGLTTINTFFAVTKKSVRPTAAAQRLLQTILAEFKASPVGLPLETATS